MSYPPLTLTAWLRYDLLRRLLDRLPNVETVLEIGVGEGAVGARLASAFNYIGVEQDTISWQKARSRIERFGGTVLHGDPSVLPAAASFDLICAFEVLEHIEDDRTALRDWRSRLNPQGALIISVPAFRRRYGAWDDKAGHYRRYEREELTAVLREAGFHEPLIWTYGFPLGYLLESVRHRLARRRAIRSSLAERTAASGRALQPPAALGWATKLASFPFRLLQRPFRSSRRGIGLVALARRSDEPGNHGSPLR